MTDAANTAIWSKLKRTDPKATKPFKRSGFSGTQVDPTWRLQMLTEVFGPCGYGWGYEVTAPVISGDLIYIGARLWYVMPGETPAETDPATKAPKNARWSGMQYGGDVMLKARREGAPVLNDEAAKMAVTDAIGKAALTIGLAADIYMGQFDESKYREESEAFFAARSNPDLQPAAIEAFEVEVKRRVDACLDLDDLEEVWRAGVGDRLRAIGTVDKAAQYRVTSLFGQKKADILKKDEKAATEQDNKPSAPPPAPAAEPIVLFLAEGEVQEFHRTLKGAEAYFHALDDLVRRDRYFWQNNAPTAEKVSADLMEKAPHIARMLDGIKAMVMPAAAE